MKIPAIFQSSVDPEQVSLTITSIGKAVGYFIVFLGAAGIVDPMVATQVWGSFVAAVITAVPAGFAVYHTGQTVIGFIRKIGVRLVQLMGYFSKTTPTAPPTAV